MTDSVNIIKIFQKYIDRYIMMWYYVLERKVIHMTTELETLKDLYNLMSDELSALMEACPKYEYYNGFYDAYKIVNTYYMDKLEEELKHIREGK